MPYEILCAIIQDSMMPRQSSCGFCLCCEELYWSTHTHSVNPPGISDYFHWFLFTSPAFRQVYWPNIGPVVCLSFYPPGTWERLINLVPWWKSVCIWTPLEFQPLSSFSCLQTPRSLEIQGKACRILCREARTSPSQVRMNLSPNQTTKSDTMGLRLQEADNFMGETQWLLWWKRGEKIKQKFGRDTRHLGVSARGWMGLKPFCWEAHVFTGPPR